jgi:OmpA-OmpF porin, OOP family
LIRAPAFRFALSKRLNYYVAMKALVSGRNGRAIPVLDKVIELLRLNVMDSVWRSVHYSARRRIDLRWGVSRCLPKGVSLNAASVRWNLGANTRSIGRTKRLKQGRMMKGRLVLGLLLMAVTLQAQAGPYAGFKVGKLDYDLPYFEDPTTFEVFLGNRFNENFAVELNYIDLGESEDGIPPVWTLSGDSVGIGLRLFLPLSETVEFTGRLGIHSWQLELHEAGTGTIADDDGTDLFYGVGVNVGLTPNIGMGAHYTVYDLDEEDASVLSFDLQFRF